MKWSDEHDLILCRKVLVVDPFIGGFHGSAHAQATRFNV